MKESSDNKSDTIWASYFPDNCPPEKANPQERKVFRIVNNWPTEKKDFLPYILTKDPPYYEGKECIASGLSVWGCEQDVLYVFKGYSRTAKKRKKIAIGLTTKESGKLCSTEKKSHLTWWTYKDIEPHTYFNELLDIKENK